MDSQRNIPPNPPRWEQNPDPGSIHVPGLDTNAPVLDQIEQIEQLITIKLQNIDETFSKINHVLANRILPAVKRYAVGTEPVREAAKFWTSFYEQAAQIRIPTYDEFSSTNEQQESSSTAEVADSEAGAKPDANTTRSQPTESTITSVESSFLPTQAAFSSTPATLSRQQEQSETASENARQQSWTSSIDSSLACLDKELRDLGRNDNHIASSSVRSTVDQSSYVTAPIEHSTSRKDKQSEQLFRQALHSASGISTASGKSSIPYVSPLKFRKPKTPIPKNLNPYLPLNTQPADWSGIVDLAQGTPKRTKHGQSSARRNATFRPLIPMGPQDVTADDSFDGLPAGMSPPILMSPARPPRSSAELILGKTPTREAAERITRDLISDVQRGNQSIPMRRNIHYSGIESSMSTLPTPPSLTQYLHGGQYGTDTSGSLAFDSSLERMMERMTMPVPHSASSTAGDPGPSSNSIPTPAQDAVTPTNQGYQDFDDGDFNSDSDSMDDINNTAHPSAAFLMASQRPVGFNDSFDSTRSSDSEDDDVVDEGLVPVHPFARGNVGDDEDGFDDSFDDPAFVQGGSQDTETLFGVPRDGRQVGRIFENQGKGLVMLGQDRLQDASTQMARIGGQFVQDSPTPAVAPFDQSSLH